MKVVKGRRRRWFAAAPVLALLMAGCGQGGTPAVSATPAVVVVAGAATATWPAFPTEPPTLPPTLAGPPTPTQTRVVTATWTYRAPLVTATPAPSMTATLAPAAIATTTATLTGTVAVSGTQVAASTATPAPALAVIAPGNVLSLSVVAAAGPGLGVTESADITATATVTAGAALTPTSTVTPTPVGLGARMDDVAWAADGQQLAAAGAFGILIYDSAGGRVADTPARMIDTPSWATSAAFSPDGMLLAVGGVDHLVRVFDLATGDLRVLLAGKTGRVEALAWVSVPLAARPSGAVLVSLNGETVHLWDVGEQTHLGSLPPAQGARLAVTGGGAPLVAVGGGATVRVWDVLELLRAENLAAAPPWRVLEQAAPVTSVALSGDGRRLAAGNSDGTIVLWNVVTAQTTLTLARLNAPAERLVFSPDGLVLTSAHSDRLVRLWAAGNGALLRTLDEQADRITALGFAPDGRALSAAGWEGVVRLYGLSTSPP